MVYPHIWLRSRCSFPLQLSIRCDKALILLLKSLYRAHLPRKSLILPLRGCLICLHLLANESQLVTKRCTNRRLSVFDYEVIELLELVNHAHSEILPTVLIDAVQLRFIRTRR